MAKKQEVEKDANQKVRDFLTGFLRNGIILLIAVIGLGYVGYHAYRGTGDPRLELKTVPDTMGQYSSFVNRYVGTTGIRPPATVIGDWLSFMDKPSRDFFYDNYKEIARVHSNRTLTDYKTLSDSDMRSMAMAEIVNRPPMSGTSRIIAQRPANDGSILVTAINRDGREMIVHMIQDGELYYFKGFGGILSSIEGDVMALSSAN